MTHVIALNFHGIGRPQRALEPGEGPFWVSLGQFERVLDFVVTAPDSSHYVITFDDGNLSDVTIALPALKARNLSARFFVLTGRIGTKGSLDRDHIGELKAAGMLVGSHGISHRPWTEANQEALNEEIIRSRDVLENILGKEVTEAGIPFGRYDARVLRALRRAGYTAAWSSDGGKMNPTGFLRPRTSLRGDMSDEDLAAVFAARASHIRKLRRTLGKMKRRFLPVI